MSDFTVLDQEEVVEGNEVIEVAPKAAKKSAQPAYFKEFVEKLKSEPELKDQMYSWSEYVEVVNTCGYGDRGALVQVNKGVKVKDEETGKSKIEGRGLDTTSVIVGYTFKNIGPVAIDYTTEVWSKNAEGKIVSEIVDRQLQPNDSVCLSKKYTTLFASKIELSHKFANAKLICTGTGKKKLHEILESSYVVFTEEGENKKAVHDGDIKIQIADRVEEKMVKDKAVGVFKVKEAYFETFGFLDIEKEKAARPAKEEIKGDYKSAAAADHIRNLMAKAR